MARFYDAGNEILNLDFVRSVIQRTHKGADGKRRNSAIFNVCVEEGNERIVVVENFTEEKLLELCGQPAVTSPPGYYVLTFIPNDSGGPCCHKTPIVGWIPTRGVDGPIIGTPIPVDDEKAEYILCPDGTVVCQFDRCWPSEKVWLESIVKDGGVS